MNLHEYQAKIILRRYGIPVPDFAVASTLEEVEEIIAQLGLDEAILKIQVHAGGRGRGGGVKAAKNRVEILSLAKQLLGMKLINNQTGKDGVIAHQILLSPLLDYKKEYYVGVIIDRSTAQAKLIVSPEGGMEIEEIAMKTPEKILTMPISLEGCLRSYQLLELSKFMGWTGLLAEQGRTIFSALAKAFIECDASLIEINPLIETKNGELLALDAKISIDDDALFRQPELFAFHDPSQLNPFEARAKEYDLAYVAMEGDIGCMVNGAGLAMATMDIIHHYGGTPANFLDVGGGASEDKVAEGFKIILSDSRVKAILVNIFGGIMNCITLAAGIIAAAKEFGIRVPLVVRMEGTNVEQGKKMLGESDLPIIIAKDLADAASKVVEAAKKGP
jgi:succinyl-CoA synthetase beta subunit